MLRHAQIRSKVVAILALPLAGLMVLAAADIGTTLARGAEAGRRNDLAQLAVRGNTLVHELQAERTLSSDWVSAKRKGAAVPRDGMLAQRIVVDRTALALERFVDRLDTDAYDPRVRQALDRALKEVQGLRADRRVLDDGASSPTAEAVEDAYSAVVSALLDPNAAIALGSDDEALFRSVSTFVALSRLKDTTDLERGFRISQLLAADPERRRAKRFISLVTQRESWLAQLRVNATPEQLDRYEASTTGPEARRIATIEQLASSGGTADLKVIGTGEQLDRTWFAAMTERVNKLRRVERELAAHLLATSRSIESSANRQTVLWLAGMAVLLLAAVLLSLVIARSLIEPLRQLQDTAEAVARQLPQAVERIQRLHDSDQVGMPMPGRARPFDASATDEISRVARSFNAAHEVAIRVASEQAALRRSIADMFQNLAQRSGPRPPLPRAGGRTRTGRDPTRNAGAAVPGRPPDDPDAPQRREPHRPRRHGPAQLVGPSRAAERADPVGHRRGGGLPAGRASTHQRRGGRRARRGRHHPPARRADRERDHVLPARHHGHGGHDRRRQRARGRDRGQGNRHVRRPARGANQILADPPAVDSALSRRLGLHVVARLAKRHDIRVQLRDSWYGGVTALVLLPAHLLARPSDQTGTAVREADQVTQHVWSPVPQAAAVAVMPPSPGWTGQPASARQLPLRGHAPQPASQGPVPSHELRGPQEQWWQSEPPPNSDEASAPPTSGGLPYGFGARPGL